MYLCIIFFFIDSNSKQTEQPAQPNPYSCLVQPDIIATCGAEKGSSNSLAIQSEPLQPSSPAQRPSISSRQIIRIRLAPIDSRDIISTAPKICQSEIDEFLLETLLPREFSEGAITQLREKRRILLTGPNGIGKSWIACRLAHFLAQHPSILFRLKFEFTLDYLYLNLS